MFVRAFIANTDDVIVFGPLAHEREDALGLVPRNVDAEFGYHLHGERAELPGLRAAGLDFEELAAGVFQQRFRHLAAAAVMGADEQDFFHTMLLGWLFVFKSISGIRHRADRNVCRSRQPQRQQPRGENKASRSKQTPNESAIDALLEADLIEQSRQHGSR